MDVVVERRGKAVHASFSEDTPLEVVWKAEAEAYTEFGELHAEQRPGGDVRLKVAPKHAMNGRPFFVLATTWKTDELRDCVERASRDALRNAKETK